MFEPCLALSIKSSFLILSLLQIPNLSLLVLFLCLSALYPEQRLYAGSIIRFLYLVFLPQAVSCWNWRKFVFMGLNHLALVADWIAERDNGSYTGGMLIIVSP